MTTSASRRYAEAMTRLRDLDPEAYRAIRARVESYKGLNQRLRDEQRNLVASVIQLENDCITDQETL